jgi:predicted metal-dependent hydrolase
MPTPPRLPSTARSPHSAGGASHPRSSAQQPSRPLPPPQPRTITLGGTEIPYLLTVSGRARRLRLVIRPGSGLQVIVPRGAGLAWIEGAIREKSAWITRKLASMATQAILSPPPLVEGRVLSYLGEPVRLALATGAAPGRFRAALREGVLTLTLAAHDEATVRAALEAWYRRQARVVFAARLAHCNTAYGFSFGRVTIKDQKSRWGSCSQRGNLNFNWRLLLAPLSVLDYVVYHELAHLKEPNHASAFWALVATACPDYRQQRRWLKQHSQELRF